MHLANVFAKPEHGCIKRAHFKIQLVDRKERKYGKGAHPAGYYARLFIKLMFAFFRYNTYLSFVIRPCGPFYKLTEKCVAWVCRQDCVTSSHGLS